MELGFHSTQFSIKTTTRCNGGCNDCSVKAWMDDAPNYHVPLEDVDQLIYYSKQSGYTFDLMSLSGGEPLLWENLVSGVQMLRKSGVFKRIGIVTNGLSYMNLPPVIEALDYVQVSWYNGNGKQVDFLKGEYPDKVRVSDERSRPVPPMDPVEDSLPADCHCTGWTLDQGKVWVCASVNTIVKRLGLVGGPGICRPLGKDYLERFRNFKLYLMNECRWCIGNKKVWDKVPRVECILGGNRGAE